MKLLEVVFFLTGLSMSSIIVFILRSSSFSRIVPKRFKSAASEIHKQTLTHNEHFNETMSKRQQIGKAATGNRSDSKQFDETLSNFLYHEVKVLCMVMTQPENHKSRAIYIKNTWGKRCNKLLFMSSKLDDELDPMNVVVLPIQESRDALWNKTKESFKYAYDHHLNEYDWFMKADDDKYMLSQYDARTALYFGHRYAVGGGSIEEGYMAGGGYILSRKALIKLKENIVDNETLCNSVSTTEDWHMGECLAHSALFVDCRDDLKQNRFFPVGPEAHMQDWVDQGFWYTAYQYYHVFQGNTDCCSAHPVGFHYVVPREMYALEYFIYNSQPFGLDRIEVLPRKFSLQEIIAASDVISPSPNFKNHTLYHNIEPSEVV